MKPSWWESGRPAVSLLATTIWGGMAAWFAIDGPYIGALLALPVAVAWGIRSVRSIRWQRAHGGSIWG